MNQPVDHVQHPAQGVGQGVIQSQAGVAEGHSRRGAGDAEVFQGVQGAGFQGHRQVLDDEFDGLEGVKLRERGGQSGDVGLHRVGHGVDGGRDDEGPGFGGQDFRVDDGDVGHQRSADDGHFDRALHVVDDGELGNVGPAARRGGQKDHGGQRMLDAVGPFVVVNRSAVAHHQRDALGRVHGAAAAQRHHHVAALFPVAERAVPHLEISGIGHHFGVVVPVQTFLPQHVQNLLHPSGLFQSGVADEEDLFRAQPAGADPGVLQAAPAKENFRDGKFADV